MSSLTNQTPHLATEVASQPAVRPKPREGTLPCLVVSCSESRRELLRRAAINGGWAAVACADVATARCECARTAFKMAIVDVEGVGEESVPREFNDLCRPLSTSDGLLLVVCGHEGSAAEEIWARQLGSWAYLPGVREGTDLSTLCGEAREVARRATHVTRCPA